MREYETGIIVQPEISDEGSQAILAKVDQTLEKIGATRLFCEDQGKRKLAYEINKFHKGHYYYLSYLDDGQSVAELERVLRLDESVLRFMTVSRSELVEDVEARVEQGRQQEEEQQRRAAERAARDAEEAVARAEAEKQAAERAAVEAAEAAARAEAESAAEAADEGSPA